MSPREVDIDELFDRNADTRLLERRRREELGLPPSARPPSAMPARFGPESMLGDGVLLAAPRGAMLRVGVDARPARELIPGAVVTVVVEVADDGDTDADDVLVRVALPPDAEPIPGSFARDEVEIDGEALLGEGLRIGTIPAAAFARVRFSMRVLPGTDTLDVAAHAEAPGVPAVAGPALRLARRAGHAAFDAPRPFFELEAGESVEADETAEEIAAVHVVDAVVDEPAAPPVTPLVAEPAAASPAPVPAQADAAAEPDAGADDAEKPLLAAPPSFKLPAHLIARPLEPEPEPKTAPEAAAPPAPPVAPVAAAAPAAPEAPAVEAAAPAAPAVEPGPPAAVAPIATPAPTTPEPAAQTEAEPFPELELPSEAPVEEAAPEPVTIPEPEPFPELELPESSVEAAATAATPEPQAQPAAIAPEPQAEPAPEPPAAVAREPEPVPEPQPEVVPEQPDAVAVPEPPQLLARVLDADEVRALERVFVGAVPHGLAALALLSSVAAADGALGHALGVSTFARSVAAALPRALVAARMNRPTPSVVTPEALARIMPQATAPHEEVPYEGALLVARLDTRDLDALRTLLARNLPDPFLRGVQVLLAVAPRAVEGVPSSASDAVRDALAAYRVAAGAWLMRVTVRRAVDRTYDPLTADDPSLHEAGRTLVVALRAAVA
jgi:hypothetical protein